MLKLIFLFCISICVFKSEAQENKNEQGNAEKYYFEKYKSKKKIASVLLISGASVCALSLLWFSESQKDNEILNNDIGGQGVLIIAGTASMIASVPYFISAHKNKRKSVSARIGVSKFFINDISGCSLYKIQPSLMFRISLGN